MRRATLFLPILLTIAACGDDVPPRLDLGFGKLDRTSVEDLERDSGSQGIDGAADQRMDGTTEMGVFDDGSAEDLGPCEGERPCATGLPGICGEGRRRCVGDQWSACQPLFAVGEKEEVCGGDEDEDCDGKIDRADEACQDCEPGKSEDCQTALLGVCGPGKKVCEPADGGAIYTWGACVSTRSAAPVEICGNASDDDCDGDLPPEDDDCGSCTDGKVNRDETDKDCGGPECDGCDHGERCLTPRDCAMPLVCQAGQCRHPGGCKELKALYPTAESGAYVVQCPGSAPMQVLCDMTTTYKAETGGWTEITLPLARYQLGGQVVAVEAAPVSGMDTTRPYTQDQVGAHTYHYTFDFRCGYRDVLLRGYTAKAHAVAPHVSDIDGAIFRQVSWTRAYGGEYGDISFGSPTLPGPTTSFARETPSQKCDVCTLPWPANRPFTVSLKNELHYGFRIGWGEEGGESEGWYPWWGGTILLR